MDKIYRAVVSGKPGSREQELFRQGLDIGDEKKTLPAELEIPGRPSGLQRGGNHDPGGAGYHQIKRMFEAVGMKVLFLKRISMGPLTLDEALEPGQARPLTEEETAALKGV